MVFFNRNRDRERRLVDELLEQAADARRQRADNARLLAEGREVFEVAKQSAGFGPALADACRTAMAAERDCDLLEQRSGLTRPSRVPPRADMAALWKALPY